MFLPCLRSAHNKRKDEINNDRRGILIGLCYTVLYGFTVSKPPSDKKTTSRTRTPLRTHNSLARKEHFSGQATSPLGPFHGRREVKGTLPTPRPFGSTKFIQTMERPGSQGVGSGSSPANSHGDWIPYSSPQSSVPILSHSRPPSGLQWWQGTSPCSGFRSRRPVRIFEGWWELGSVFDGPFVTTHLGSGKDPHSVTLGASPTPCSLLEVDVPKNRRL